jgi:superfamily II DNA or RNA helicase
MSKKVKVKLTNRVAYIQATRNHFKKLDKLLKFHPKGYEYSPAYKYYKYHKDDSDYDGGGWDGYSHLLKEKNNSLPAGLFRAMQAELAAKTKVKWRIREDFDPVFFKSKGVTSKEKKWQFQNEALKAMMEATEQGGGLLINATGTGKTKISGMYFSWLDGNGLFIVDELTLLKQAKKALEEVLKEKVGIVGESKFRPRRITVATIQTMHKYREHREFRKWTKTLSVIMIDEVHIQINRRNFQTIASINPPAVFGLTATLALKKKSVKMRAYSLCGPVVYTFPLQKGQATGVLDHGVVVQVDHHHFSPKTRGKLGYITDYTELIVECDQRNSIVKAIVKEAIKRKKYVVVLVERRQHIQDMSKLLRKIPHLLAYGAIHSRDRFAAVKEMNAGEVNLILASSVFKKGIDLSRLNVIIDAAAKKSNEDAIQKFGRGVRKHVEKNGLIYFDIADSGNRFERASKKRRSAFKSVGIPIIQHYYINNNDNGWISTLFDKAEYKLQKLKNKHTNQV